MSEFSSKRRIIVQLLKDWADQFGSTTLKGERAANSGGHWLLTGEILKLKTKQTDVYESKRLLAAELRRMREESPYYTYLKRVFLTEGAAHSTYDAIRAKARMDAAGVWDGLRRLKRNFSDLDAEKGGHPARTLVTYWENNASDEMKVEHAIDLLTRRCEHLDLHCDFPSNSVTIGVQKKTREQTKEESQAEIRRVFEHWCEQIQANDPKAKKYRNKAINNTATTCEVHRATVIRAINAGDATKEEAS